MNRLRWDRIGVVASKELREAVRDRRSLAAALLYSLFGPLVLALVLGRVVASLDEQPLAVAVVGAERAPALLAFLAGRDARLEPVAALPLTLGAPDGPSLGLVLAADLAERFAAGRPGRVELHYDSGRQGAEADATRLAGLLEQYGRGQLELRLLARGVAPALAQPLEVHRSDHAFGNTTLRRTLEMVPMFLVLAVFVCGMALAIDATAGERERGSLEALLCHPVSPAEIVAGKWLAVVALAALGGLGTWAVTQAALSGPRFDALGLAFDGQVGQLLALGAVLLPLALLVPAVQMGVSLFAKSYKEAQAYLSLLLFVPLLPGYALAFGWNPEAPGLALVPLVGHQIGLGRALAGEAEMASTIGLAAVTLGLTALVLAGVVRALRRERLLLGA
jgi:sodium transport system permease protein